LGVPPVNLCRDRKGRQVGVLGGWKIAPFRQDNPAPKKKEKNKKKNKSAQDTSLQKPKLATKKGPGT